MGTRDDIIECYEMISNHSARLLRLDGYGLEVGKKADLVVLNCYDRATAITELADTLWGFKRGRVTFTRKSAELHRPGPIEDDTLSISS